MERPNAYLSKNYRGGAVGIRNLGVEKTKIKEKGGGNTGTGENREKEGTCILCSGSKKKVQSGPDEGGTTKRGGEKKPNSCRRLGGHGTLC